MTLFFNAQLATADALADPAHRAAVSASMEQIFPLLKHAALALTNKVRETSMVPVVPPRLNAWARAEYSLQYAVTYRASWDNSTLHFSNEFIELPAGSSARAHIYTVPFDKEAALGTLMYPIVGGEISMHFDSTLKETESGPLAHPPQLYSAAWTDSAALQAVFPLAFPLRKSRVTPIIRMHAKNMFASRVSVATDVTIDKLPRTMMQSVVHDWAGYLGTFAQQTLDNSNQNSSRPFAFLNRAVAYDQLLEDYFNVFDRLHTSWSRARASQRPVVLAELAGELEGTVSGITNDSSSFTSEPQSTAAPATTARATAPLPCAATYTELYASAITGLIPANTIKAVDSARTVEACASACWKHEHECAAFVFNADSSNGCALKDTKGYAARTKNAETWYEANVRRSTPKDESYRVYNKLLTGTDHCSLVTTTTSATASMSAATPIAARPGIWLAQMWRTLCVACSSNTPGSVIVLLGEIVQVGHPSMRQFLKYVEYDIQRRLRAMSTADVPMKSLFAAPEVDLVTSNTGAETSPLHIMMGVEHSIWYATKGLGEMRPIVERLHAAMPDSAAAQSKLKFHYEKNSDERIGAVRIDAVAENAVTRSTMRLTSKTTWDVTELFNRGTRLDTITDQRMLPTPTVTASITGFLVSDFQYDFQPNHTYTMAFDVDTLPTRTIERAFEEGSGTAKWETDASFEVGSAEPVSSTVFASADIEWSFLVNSNRAQLFVKNEAIDPALLLSLGHIASQRAVIWMVEAMCQSDLILQASMGIKQDIADLVDYIRLNLNVQSKKYSKIQEIAARLDLDGDGADMLGPLSTTVTAKLFGHVDQLADSVAGVLQKQPDALVDLAGVSSALSKAISVLDIELCAYSTRTNFRLQAKVGISVPETLTLALDGTTFEDQFKGVSGFDAPMNASLDFVATHSRQLVHTRTLSFKGLPVCAGGFVPPEKALEELTRMPGSFRFAAGSQGTFGCAGESITFIKTTADDMTVELRKDPVRDTVSLELTVAVPVGLTKPCTTIIRAGQKQIMWVPGMITQYKVEATLEENQRLAIVLGGGNCEVTVRNVQFYVASVGNAAKAANVLNSVALSFSGRYQQEADLAVGHVAVELAMQQFGVKVIFNDDPVVEDVQSGTGTVVATAASPTRVVGIGSFKGSVALGAKVPAMFTELGLDLPPISIVFHKLGDAKFDYFFDMDLTDMAEVITSFVGELKLFNIGLPDLISGTRAMTMPIPRFIDFSSILSKLKDRVVAYFSQGEFTSLRHRRGTTGNSGPSLMGLAEWVSSSSEETKDYSRFFQLAGSIRFDKVAAKLMFQFDLTMSYEIEKTFAGSDAIASTCDSLYEQLTTKPKYAKIFTSAVNVSRFQGGRGCGSVSVEGDALLRTLVNVDFQKMARLANGSAAAATTRRARRGLTAGQGTAPAVHTWGSPGTFSYVVPAGTTQITVDVWGGGGGGGAGNGRWAAGGGGGGYSRQIIYPTPGTAITVTVGAGGAGDTTCNFDCAGGGDGATSSFASVTASGGRGGTDTTNNNCAGTDPLTRRSAGGSGTTAQGVAGGRNTGGTYGFGGAGGGEGGGTGGVGVVNYTPGNAGSAPGGGGSGGPSCQGDQQGIAPHSGGGNGATGRVTITIVQPSNIIGMDTGIDTSDVIADSVISLHPDTRFEVDVVAKPDIPYLDSDIRLHLLAHVGEQGKDAGTLRIRDLADRGTLMRYFRGLKWREFSGNLDALFRAQFDINFDLLGVNRDFKFEPVLSLSSDNLLGGGFGLTALVDIGLAGSSSSPGATANLDELFETISEKILGHVEALIEDVKDLQVPDLPSLFKPLLGKGKLQLAVVAQAFKTLWTQFASYRLGISTFIKLADRHSLKGKVLEALEALIFQVTGIVARENPEHYLALVHDMFGMLLPDGGVPSVEELRSINPYAAKLKAVKAPSALSQYHLGTVPPPEHTDEERVLRLLSKVLPRQLTLRGLFSFCMRYIKTELARLAHKGQLAAMDAWKKYHQHLNTQATFEHAYTGEDASLATSIDLVIETDSGGMLTVDVNLSLQTVADLVGLLGQLGNRMSGLVTSAVAEDGMASKVLSLGNSSGEVGNSLVVSKTSLQAGVEVGVKIEINTSQLLRFQTKNAFALAVTGLKVNAGASLRADELRLKFGSLALEAEMQGAINIYGALQPRRADNRTRRAETAPVSLKAAPISLKPGDVKPGDATPGDEEPAFGIDVSQPISAQLKEFWNRIAWSGNYSADVNVTLTSLPKSLERFFTKTNTAEIAVSNDNLFKVKSEQDVAEEEPVDGGVGNPTSGVPGPGRARRGLTALLNRSVFGFDLSQFIVVVKNIKFPTCEQQERIANEYLASVGLFTETVSRAGNAALGSVKSNTISVLGDDKPLADADTLGNASFGTPAPAVDGGSINLKDTFDDLLTGVGMDVRFCVIPDLNDNILQINLYLSIAASIVLSTPALSTLGALTKQEGTETQSPAIAATGAFAGEAFFYVNASMIVHLGILDDDDRRTRRSMVPGNLSDTVPKNSTLLHIAAGFRANAKCNLEVSRNGLNFLNGTASLTDAGFDVLFPYGGQGSLHDMRDALSSTTISPPTGNFSAHLEFDANNALQIGALKDLGLEAPKFTLSLHDNNVFSNASEMSTVIDFDVTEFKEYILRAMATIAGMEFGFGVAGLQPNVPVALRGALRDLSDKMKLVQTAAVAYFEACADDLPECGPFGYPTMRGLFAAIEDVVMSDTRSSYEGAVTFGNDVFSMTVVGGYDLDTRQLSIRFLANADFAKESDSLLTKFFGSVDSLFSRLSDALPLSAKNKDVPPQAPALFDGISLYLKLKAFLDIELTLDFSKDVSTNATTSRCSNSRIAVGPGKWLIPCLESCAICFVWRYMY